MKRSIPSGTAVNMSPRTTKWPEMALAALESGAKAVSSSFSSSYISLPQRPLCFLLFWSLDAMNRPNGDKCTISESLSLKALMVFHSVLHAKSASLSFTPPSPSWPTPDPTLHKVWATGSACWENFTKTIRQERGFQTLLDDPTISSYWSILMLLSLILSLRFQCSVRHISAAISPTAES